jgi:hypothetical protein
MEYALSNATAVDGTNVMWAGSGVGKVVPGSYIVRIEEKLLQKQLLKSNLIRE